MKWKPLYDKIIIELKNSQEVKSASGLVYNKDMGSSKFTTLEGVVVACGEGRLLSNGDIVPLKVKVGDMAMFPKMSGESFNEDSKDYVILSEANILSYKEQ